MGSVLKDHDQQAGELVSEHGGDEWPSRSDSPELTRLLGWAAAAAIAVSTLIVIAISAAGPSVSVPAMRQPAGGPPWWHVLHLTATFVTVSLWAAMALGCA